MRRPCQPWNLHGSRPPDRSASSTQPAGAEDRGRIEASGCTRATPLPRRTTQRLPRADSLQKPKGIGHVPHDPERSLPGALMISNRLQAKELAVAGVLQPVWPRRASSRRSRRHHGSSLAGRVWSRSDLSLLAGIVPGGPPTRETMRIKCSRPRGRRTDERAWATCFRRNVSA